MQAMVKSASKPDQGWMAATFGFVMLLLGASGVLGQLKDALNTVWGVKPKPGAGTGATAEGTTAEGTAEQRRKDARQGQHQSCIIPCSWNRF